MRTSKLSQQPTQTLTQWRNDGTRSPLSTSGTPSRSITPLSPGKSLLQRQCACGGGCPRCQENGGIQTKLKISEPGDPYEQEADRIADEVMRMPEPVLQRQVEPEEEDKEERVQAKAIAPTKVLPPMIQRKENEENGCDGTVNQMFKLLAAIPSPGNVNSVALIARRDRPDNESKVYHIGDWLNDYMVIVDILYVEDPVDSTVVIMHCEKQELLKLDTFVPMRLTILLEESNFGPGTLQIQDDCKYVEFVPQDPSKPRQVFIQKILTQPGSSTSVVFYAHQSDDQLYAPMDVENMLRTHLSEEQCGTSKPQKPQEPIEDKPLYGPF